MSLLAVLGRVIHRFRNLVDWLSESGDAVHTPGRTAPVRDLELVVIPDEINPDQGETIAVEVSLPQGLDERFQSNPAYLGVRDAFDVDRDEEGRVTAVSMAGAYEDGGLASPVGMRSVSGHEGHWILNFRAAEIDTSEVADGPVTLGLLVTGRERMWGTDSVSIPPRGTDN